MSLSATLASALSGLTVNARAAETVSSNVANALTPGYGRRDIALATAPLYGVQVTGVTRDVDERLVGDRRLADAAVGFADTRAGAADRISAVFGAPGDGDDLAGLIDAFAAALTEATSRPDLTARLDAAVVAAGRITDELGRRTDQIQDLRQTAEAAIGDDVARLNDGLKIVADLNAEILRQNAHGREVAGLLDQRQAALDSIGDIVPIRTYPRQDGAVAVVTETGGVLLDGGRPAVVGFTPATLIVPDMTLASGGLSGLTLNGRPVDAGAAFGPLSGGSLAAHFKVRDVDAPAAQDRLDALARDLVERFEDPAVDPTLGAGDPGLFTVNGAALDPADTVGLAGRLAVNAAVDPAEGGATWRLRDGIGAAAPGPAGLTTTLQALSAALDAPRLPATGGFAAARGASGLASDVMSSAARDRAGAELGLTFATARQEGLRDAELAKGVDTDAEMQRLLLIEQAYAANARVIEVVNTLLDRLTRL